MRHFARRRILAASAALALSTMAATAFAQKAIVVVRHAEKVDQSTDPVLSAEGTARAEALAKALRSLDVKAVYVTQYQRTALTARSPREGRGPQHHPGPFGCEC